MKTFPARELSAKTITPEKQVQNSVVAQLRLHGFMVVRNQQGLGHVKGRPDLEAYKNGTVIFIECKAPRGRLSEHQVKYIRTLEGHGMRVMVVNDAEKFLDDLEALQEELWPGKNLRRLC